MKTKLRYLLGCIFGLSITCLLLYAYTPAKAQGNPNKRIPDVVMLQYKTIMGPLISTPSGTYREPADMVVEYSSRSHNSPIIPNGASMGESMSFLMGQGFTWKQIGVNQFVFER